MLFIMGCVTVVVFIITDCFGSLLKKCNLSSDDKVELIDENVGTFFQCVSVPERKRMFSQELHWRKNLGIETMGQQSMDQMRTTKGNIRVIKNAPSYEILSNIGFM